MIDAPMRLVATDLDGTLLYDDGTISSRTRQAIARAEAAGLAVVLVTARPPRVLRTMARQAGVTGLAICCNGAIVYDLTTDEIVAHRPLAPTTAQRLVAALRVAVPGVCFAVERGPRFGQEPRYAAVSPIAGDDTPLIDDADALCAEDVTKLIVLHPDAPLQDLLRAARKAVGDEAIVTHSSALFVEVSAAGVTKAAALQGLCAQLGVDAARVVACGDMPNDLPMLAWAGHSVAVANAHPDVLAAVAEVTLSNNEDGVARVLERETTVVIAARQWNGG
jgi:Cof subfamily protein (haloacid dehalogenase superfamily)